MVYDTNVGGVPAITHAVGGGRDSDYGHQSWWWIFGLIFLALIFLWGRRDKERCGLESVMPALAMGGGLKGHNGCGCEHRDLLLETGNIKKECLVVLIY